MQERNTASYRLDLPGFRRASRTDSGKRRGTLFTKIVATAVIAGMVAPVAFAEGLSTAGEKEYDGIGIQAPRASTTVSGEEEMSESEIEGNRGSDKVARGGDNTTTTGEQEQEQHRSEVAKQVQELLQAADRDEDIGDEVREAAHEVASSSERAGEVEASVERRPSWLTFIIGSDYGNLEKLRSEITTTQNAIDRLAKARDRATSSTTQTTLGAQISALKDSASSTEMYIKAHENLFSVFGWFFKLFSR